MYLPNHVIFPSYRGFSSNFITKSCPSPARRGFRLGGMKSYVNGTKKMFCNTGVSVLPQNEVLLYNTCGGIHDIHRRCRRNTANSNYRDVLGTRPKTKMKTKTRKHENTRRKTSKGPGAEIALTRRRTRINVAMAEQQVRRVILKRLYRSRCAREHDPPPLRPDPIGGGKTTGETRRNGKTDRGKRCGKPSTSAADHAFIVVVVGKNERRPKYSHAHTIVFRTRHGLNEITFVLLRYGRVHRRPE